MSYNTITQCAMDGAFRQRVTACAAQEGAYDPAYVMNRLIWPVSTTSDVEAAYAYAIAAENPNPGGDETVITDAMILAKVQAFWDDTWENPPPSNFPEV